jgi:hypothetical protein
MDQGTFREVSEALDATAVELANQTAAIAVALIEAGLVKADDIEAALAKRPRPGSGRLSKFRSHDLARRTFKEALRKPGQAPATS